MHCFTHQDNVAVASCKHCGKGLCANCAVDLGHGVACHGHEQEIEDVRAMMLRANSTHTTNTRYKYSSPLFFFALGAIFLIYGFMNPGRTSTFTMILGGAFLVYSVVVFAAVRRAFGESQTPRA